MAITRVVVASVTRSWGGETGFAKYIARRSAMTGGFANPGPQSVELGNNFNSVGEAQQACNNSFAGQSLRWEQQKLAGDIDHWVGSVSVVT